jgi:hypothetical protein
MLLRVFITIMVTSYLSFLNSMQVSQEPSFENYLQRSMHGSLQSYLYGELDKLWLQKSENPIWIKVNRYAFSQAHPVLLYFIFRTYYNFAYAFDGREIRDLPQYSTISLNFNSRLTALKSLMLFMIKSSIDSTICKENGLGENAVWIHKQFGEKFAERVSVFDKWNKKICENFGDENLTFKYVFENLQQELQNLRTFEYVNPRWIHLCSKSKWRYVGVWSETFYFADDPLGVPSCVDSAGPSTFLPSGANARENLMLTSILLRVELLVARPNLTDLKKWEEFLLNI